MFKATVDNLNTKFYLFFSYRFNFFGLKKSTYIDLIL